MGWGTTEDSYLNFIVVVGAMTVFGMSFLAVPYGVVVGFLLWLRNRQANPPEWWYIAKVSALVAIAFLAAGFAVFTLADGGGEWPVTVSVAALSVAGWTFVASLVAGFLAARKKGQP